MLRYLPKKERPRERFLELGVDAVSLTELLAIVLGTGTKGKSAFDLANELLSSFGGVEGLLLASVEELQQIKGLGRAKALVVKASLGIALKIKKGNSVKKSIDSPEEVFSLLGEELKREQREVLVVVLRDVRKCLIRIDRVAVGTLSNVPVHPREVFYPAVRHKASSIILVHNHPSGDPTPSRSDFLLTKSLVESGKVMGIGVADHVIIGRESYVSLKEKGCFN